MSITSSRIKKLIWLSVNCEAFMATARYSAEAAKRKFSTIRRCGFQETGQELASKKDETA